MRCFVHFDLQRALVPQRRAIFRHLSVKKWPEHAVFCTFWLTNGLGTTAACDFSTSERRAIFPDQNFKNGSEAEVFCQICFTNLLLATVACHFSQSTLPKLVPHWSLRILTYKCASRHSGMPFLEIRSSKSGPYPSIFWQATNHSENTVFRDFPNIWRMRIFFLVTLACWSSF